MKPRLKLYALNWFTILPVRSWINVHGHRMKNVLCLAMDVRYEVMYFIDVRYVTVCRAVCAKLVGATSSEGLLVPGVAFVHGDCSVVLQRSLASGQRVAIETAVVGVFEWIAHIHCVARAENQVAFYG